MRSGLQGRVPIGGWIRRTRLSVTRKTRTGTGVRARESLGLFVRTRRILSARFGSGGAAAARRDVQLVDSETSSIFQGSDPTPRLAARFVRDSGKTRPTLETSCVYPQSTPLVPVPDAPTSTTFYT